MALAWGRRYLMCPPDHFDVAYTINPWMDVHVSVDLDRARDQWEGLRSTLVTAGADVEVIDAQPGLPDMVFTANCGLVDGNRFFPGRMKHPERQEETPHFRSWFRDRGYQLVEMADDVIQEGAGDALPFRGAFVAGHRSRSSSSAYADLVGKAGWDVYPIELPDPRYYHIDLVFCPLDDDRAIIAPVGLTEDGQRVLQSLVPEPLVLEDDEAATFVANSIVIGRTVVMPSCPPRVGRQLERWGFDVAPVDVGEFLKAGGAVRCLTLALDVRTGVQASAPTMSIPGAPGVKPIAG